jgi:CheY-like chemotaxis protein
MQKKLNCVLLVDDNDSDNFIHKRVIEKAGIADLISIAQNGQEAIDFLKRSSALGQQEHAGCHPILIFLDINMPVMNGWEFLEEYRKLDEDQTSHVVIIMLSASVNSADKARTEKILGDGCFIYKPLTLERLREIMQKHFPEYT